LLIFIIKTIQISSGKNRIGEDIGQVKLKENISINNNMYLLLLKDSGQIQLLNSDGDKVQARSLLIEFLNEKKIAKIQDVLVNKFLHT